MLASIQLHVSRRCNIRCLHCYSHSGPEESQELPLDLAQQSVRDAVSEGYGNLAISGGEPLLYKPLRELLTTAKSLGMVNTVTTNGMLLDARRLKMIDGVIDLVAISLDGAPESHNQMRNSPRAFETMVQRLPALRDSGIPFGFLFTLTQYNLHELAWVADFALNEGARSLQIHPLEECGRASEELVGEAPDAREKSVAFLEFLRVQSQARDRLHVQIDLADSVSLRDRPERVYANTTSDDLTAEPLANLLNPLVVEIDGTVSPLQFGFPRPYALGNLHEHSLKELADVWRREGHGPFHDLCRRTFEDVTDDEGLPFVNWYEVLAHQARTLSAGSLLPVLSA